MSREERDAAYLPDMLRASRSVVELAGGVSAESFGHSPVVRLAVERQLITIGEAARRISDSFRAAHPEIPWPGIVGHRNVLMHQYDEVDASLLWRTATVLVPELVA